MDGSTDSITMQCQAVLSIVIGVDAIKSLFSFCDELVIIILRNYLNLNQACISIHDKMRMHCDKCFVQQRLVWILGNTQLFMRIIISDCNDMHGIFIISFQTI